MKVLILHQHFNTPQRGGAIRSYHFATSLLAQKIDVEVITAHDGADKEDTVEGIKIHYLSVPYSNGFGFYKRVISFLKFMSKAVMRARRIHAVDLCYAISVPLTVGLSAEYMRLCRNIPFIFEVGDLWPDVPIEMGFVRNYFLKYTLLKLEKRIYQSARAIVALSPPIQTVIQRKLQGGNVHLVPNVADTDFYKPTGKDLFFENKYTTKGKFVVSYIGTMGKANGLSYLVDCARVSAQARLNIQFVFCGDGALKKELQMSAQHFGLANITFLSFANRAGVGEIMNVTDAIFVCYRAVPILETGSPNKFFDGLAAGKLIIINFGGWIKKEVEDNCCGFYVSPRRPDDFVRKIKPFLTDKKLLRNCQHQARLLAEKKYSKDKMMKKLTQIVAMYGT